MYNHVAGTLLVTTVFLLEFIPQSSSAFVLFALLLITDRYIMLEV